MPPGAISLRQGKYEPFGKILGVPPFSVCQLVAISCVGFVMLLFNIARMVQKWSRRVYLRLPMNNDEHSAVLLALFGGPD